MHNTVRGEITRKIGGLELTLSPTFGRISRAESALGNKSCLKIAQDMADGPGLTTLELATFFEQLSKPRLKRDDIGKAMVKAGYKKATELLGEILNKILEGDEPDTDDESDLPDEDDEGK